MAIALEYEGKLLMPKATGVWLIENTALTFKQIADFIEMTEIEVEALANGDIGRGLVGRNPLDHNELEKDEIARCEADPHEAIQIKKRGDLPTVKVRAKGPRYTPVSKRGDKPDAIAYIIKQNPEMTDAQICKLVGTTKPTITAIRERTHANINNLRPRHPADLGLCTFTEFERVYDKALKAAGKDPEAVRAAKDAEIQKQLDESQEQSEGADISPSDAGFDFSNFLTSDLPPSSSDSGDL